MSIHVELEELADALDWLSSSESAGLDAQALVSRKDGRVHWFGEGIDEEPPEDADDDDAYVAVPHKRDLELGRELVLGFVRAHLPGSLRDVEGYFRKRGAYAKFKSLLASARAVDKWHAYEAAAVEQALTDWCARNGFVAMKKPVNG